MKRITILLAGVLMVFSCVFLTGCSSTTKEDSYTQDTFSDAPSGWYIMHADATFEPLLEVSLSNDLMSKFASGTRVPLRILTSESIPTLSSGETIVVKSESLPTRLTAIYGFEDLGYTQGFTAAKTDVTGNYSVASTDGLTKGSSAATYLSDCTPASSLISSIGGIPMSAELLNEAGSLKGLQEGGKYEVLWYEGTQAKNAEIIADCHQFLSRTDKVEAFQDVKYTLDGYAAMQLTDTLGNGYYYIDGGGFLKIER